MRKKTREEFLGSLVYNLPSIYELILTLAFINSLHLKLRKTNPKQEGAFDLLIIQTKINKK